MEALSYIDYGKFRNFSTVILFDAEFSKRTTVKSKSLAGSLQKYAKPHLIEREKEIAWGIVAQSYESDNR